MKQEWRIQGDFLLNCNCDIWCPCVLSMGKADPTYGRCLSWWCIHCKQGHYGDVTLDGLTTALLLETPGPLAEGGWTFAIYLDERGSPEADAALVDIFRGRAGGPIGWFSIMISEYLGVKKVPISYEEQETGWRVNVPKLIDGTVEPILGADGKTPVMAKNTHYWVGPDVIVSKGTKSRYRDWGRNWDLSGQSAEFARIDWRGP